MVIDKPRISVCIPCYNRANLLPELLDSILAQDFRDFEIVIIEDFSPERNRIREIANEYSTRFPDVIYYFENRCNLGFDANIRALIDRSRGEYCVFMGNDDLMCPGALRTISSTIARYPKIGVFLRSFSSFEGNPENVSQVFRYFESEKFFPAGARTISTFFKRSVVIPGVTLHRASAKEFATDRFDGTLLYQLFLVANILVKWNGVFSPEIIVWYRNGGIPDFGNSLAEKGRFIPRTRTTDSSINFMRGMLQIANDVECTRHVRIYKAIRKDLSNYSYPFLSIQAEKPFNIFFKYYISLIRVGFGFQPLFHVYFILILLIGTNRMDKGITWIKKSLGHTPLLGTIYSGNLKE